MTGEYRSYAAAKEADLEVRTIALVAALLSACSGGGTPPRAAPAGGAPVPIAEPEPDVSVEGDRAPEGAACERSGECSEGEHCRGPAGCENAWACGAPRECGEESVGFCGCDGFTFYAPENCPGRPIVHGGPCEELGVLDDEPAVEIAGSGICQSNADCRRGFVCTGSEGCSTFWTCARRRRVRPRCARSEARFCGCAGDTFEASATCPGQPFLHRGFCDGDAPEVLVEVLPPVPAPVPPRRVTAPAPARVAARRPEPPPPPAGPAVCVRNRDCPRGQVCQGPEGCTSDWHCARPAERCLSDTQYFCSCGGDTFTASMTCPGRPHRRRGSCGPG